LSALVPESTTGEFLSFASGSTAPDADSATFPRQTRRVEIRPLAGFVAIL
jgi:hypothetical protein